MTSGIPDSFRGSRFHFVTYLFYLPLKQQNGKISSSARSYTIKSNIQFYLVIHLPLPEKTSTNRSLFILPGKKSIYKQTYVYVFSLLSLNKWDHVMYTHLCFVFVFLTM